MILIKLLVSMILFYYFDTKPIESKPKCPRIYENMYLEHIRYPEPVFKYDDWKFMVAIVYEEIHACIGSLISTQWVLTSADCINGDKKYGRLGVSLNSRYLYPKFGNITPYFRSVEKNSIVRVSETYAHLDYFIVKLDYKLIARQEKINDLLLIKLNRTIKLSDQVDILPLPVNNSRVEFGTYCKIAVWGNIYSKNRYPIGTQLYFNHYTWLILPKTIEGLFYRKILRRELHLQVISKMAYDQKVPSPYNRTTSLTNVIDDLRYEDKIYVKALLTRHQNIDATAYIGDIGGALTCNGELRGVVSAIDYTQTTDPDNPLNNFVIVCADIFNSYSWIKDTMSINQDNPPPKEFEPPLYPS